MNSEITVFGQGGYRFVGNDARHRIVGRERPAWVESGNRTMEAKRARHAKSSPSF
ncbi:hypothetical protein SF83666_c22570 [Sinorhizobium fredii CCBAU 83666]|nr:hypothetical protein SF83666_c22570 [Sinorhizobium fredii CCBAU 83666]